MFTPGVISTTVVVVAVVAGVAAVTEVVATAARLVYTSGAAGVVDCNVVMPLDKLAAEDIVEAVTVVVALAVVAPLLLEAGVAVAALLLKLVLLPIVLLPWSSDNIGFNGLLLLIVFSFIVAMHESRDLIFFYKQDKKLC